MAKCLVLGANGFIGSHLVDALVKASHEVRAFSRYSSDETRYNKSDKIEKIEGDFLNRDDIKNAVKACDYVFHFISTTTPLTAENDPLIDIETNVRMSIILFEECVAGGIKKVIFASTGGAIYGTDDDKPITENTPTKPISPYAIGKLSIENYLRYFERKYGLKGLIYRISNPYGARQPQHAKQGVIPIFLDKISKNEEITIMGDGSMVRDYIYVTDVADMITATFENAADNLYNLGSGHGESVNDIVDTIEQVVGQPVKKGHIPVPSTFMQRITLDVSKFEKEFSILPKVSLQAGVKATWDSIKAKN